MNELYKKLDWDGVYVHFHEIALKGGNRRPFIKQLKLNIARALAPYKPKISWYFDRLYIEPSGDHLNEILEITSKVFGIAFVNATRTIEATVETLTEVGIELYRAQAKPNATFAVRVRRADKRFPMTSHEIEIEVGGRVQDATDAPVNLTAPDVLLSYRVYEKNAYLEGPRIQGPGGLPLGTSRKVLTLFSGGIDSPAAAWLMMRRGCSTDYVHFHVYPDAEAVRETKIPTLINQLTEPNGLYARMFLIPYHTFQLQMLKNPIPPSLELALFRRFMIRTANLLAQREHLYALITGDNLGQVASQTFENIAVLEQASELPIFRPLLTFDKKEIIALTQKIGTFETSIEEYKDCCSLVAKRPETKPTLEQVLAAESAWDVEAMAREALENVVMWKFGA